MVISKPSCLVSWRVREVVDLLAHRPDGLELHMVLLDCQEAFLVELGQIYALCKERGAGSVYITKKTVKSKVDDVERCLVRAKLSNKKHRKISTLVPLDEVTRFQDMLARVQGEGGEASGKEVTGKKRKGRNV
ncbi:unnamed protein product [Choristocarpus tenellus]